MCAQPDPARLTEEQIDAALVRERLRYHEQRQRAETAEAELRAERATSEKLREAIKCQHDWRTTERDGKTWWKCKFGCGLMELWEGGLVVEVALDV